VASDYTCVAIGGAAGFIGSNFVHYMRQTYPDYRLVGIDNFSVGANADNLAGIDENFTLVQADIADFDAMRALFVKEKVDAVVNFAAESHNDRAIADPTPFARTNALGAQQILEASRQTDVRRHVHVSTIEVYGEQDEDTPYFTEESPLNAKTPYSAAKAAGDLLVRSYMQTYDDMEIFITHCANNYGPYQFPEKLIPLSLINVLQGKKIRLYGDGEHSRDWLHVLDHCRAIDLVLHQAPAGVKDGRLPIYDISARCEVSNKVIAELLLRFLGKKYDEWVEYVTDRPNHDRRYLIEPKRIETELGFAPQIDFEQGMEETVKWYVDHPQWWQKILAANNNLVFDWSKAK
jgi:dTDP-glucose 4,6-dehydratase